MVSIIGDLGICCLLKSRTEKKKDSKTTHSGKYLTRDAKLIYESSFLHDAPFHISLDLREVPLRRHIPDSVRSLWRSRVFRVRSSPPIKPVHPSRGKKEYRCSRKLHRIVFDR